MTLIHSQSRALTPINAPPLYTVALGLSFHHINVEGHIQTISLHQWPQYFMSPSHLKHIHSIPVATKVLRLKAQFTLRQLPLQL